VDSDDVGGSVCGDAGVVVWRGEWGFAGDISESGEFFSGEFGIYGGVGGDSLRRERAHSDLDDGSQDRWIEAFREPHLRGSCTASRRLRRLYSNPALSGYGVNQEVRNTLAEF
jgi:hypothetical protein